MPAPGGWWQCGRSPSTDRGLSALFQGRGEAHGPGRCIPAASYICRPSPPPSLRTDGPWSGEHTGSALFCSPHCLADPRRVWTLLKTRLSTHVIPCPPPESRGAAMVRSPLMRKQGGPGVLPGEAGGCRWRRQRLHSWPPSLCPPPQKVPPAMWERGSEYGPTRQSVCPPEERRAREWPLDVAEPPEVRLEDWLEKRAKRLSSAPSSRYGPGVPPPHPPGAGPQPARPCRHQLPRDQTRMPTSDSPGGPHRGSRPPGPGQRLTGTRL